METANQNAGVWSGLSRSIAETVEAVQDSIVTVHGGGRSTSSGVVWRPGVIVTVRHGLRRSDSLQVALRGEPFHATLAGADAGTDLAVLRVDAGAAKPAETTGAQPVRVGEVVLAVGRSALGDISASAGIIARLGSAWRTWRGGQMDSLIRPDLQLYVGQSGSALVNEGRRVLGINSCGAGAKRGHHCAGGDHRPSGGCDSGTRPRASTLPRRRYAGRAGTRSAALPFWPGSGRGVAGTARGTQCARRVGRNPGWRPYAVGRRPPGSQCARRSASAIQSESWRSGGCSGHPRWGKNGSNGSFGGSWLRITRRMQYPSWCCPLWTQ